MSTQQTTLCRLHRHGHLAREGQEQAFLYRVVEGWACAYRALPECRRQITALYLPGEYCDPQWVLRPRATSPIVALTDLKLARIRLADVQGQQSATGASAVPGMKVVIRAVLDQLDRQTDWIVSLGRKTGTERVSAFLCELIGRAGDAARHPDLGFAVPLTQVDLADIVGMTPIHVNRILRNLKAAGLVEWKEKWLRVPHLEGLKALAAGGAPPCTEAREGSRPLPARASSRRGGSSR